MKTSLLQILCASINMWLISSLIEKRMIVCHSQSHVYQRHHHRYDILLNLLATTVVAASAISSNAANIYFSSSASTEYVKGVQCRNQCRARDSYGEKKGLPSYLTDNYRAPPTTRNSRNTYLERSLSGEENGIILHLARLVRHPPIR